MIRILGVDPGSRFTGYGLIDSDGQHARYIASGCVRVSGHNLPEKLGLIFHALGALIDEYQPEQLAIENVFMHRNADSALKLGQARGAAICAGVTRELPVAEYAPREIKQAVVGKGGADKQQVQHMVRVLLSLSETPQADAADALAIALCHSYRQHAVTRVSAAQQLHQGRLR
ncbi:Crossover junction endodeoxyribonuclease RuvC [hydrothermal vent metagenome]|uniref:Crossover junction endodeoxyribonuclease RuvC n=1 Tax=hydrothermal vent metagenome TaxID=652676 RepID=A0A3B0YQ19_9ZZZZ